MAQTPHVGDVGLALQLVIVESGAPVSLVGATTLEIVAQSPKGVSKTWPAIFVTDGTDGAIQYITEDPADLDEVGTWYMQGRVAIGGWSGNSSVASFDVAGNL